MSGEGIPRYLILVGNGGVDGFHCFDDTVVYIFICCAPDGCFIPAVLYRRECVSKGSQL